MNEEVLQDLFNRAVSKGYNKSIEEFTVLLSQNNDVLIDNFNYVKGKGYKKTIEDFKTLTGVVEGVNTTDSEVKKKNESVSISPEEVMDGGTQVVEEPGSLEPSVQGSDYEYKRGVDAQGLEIGFSDEYLATIKKAKDQGLNEYETKARLQSQQLKENQELETETQWDRSVKSLTKGLEVVDDEFLGWLDNKKKVSRDTKITDSEEEQVRYRMEYLFEDYGYEFEEFGVGDNIKITAPGSEQWVKDNPDAKEEDNPYIFKTDTDSGRDWFNLTKKAVSSVNPGTFRALLSDTSDDGKSYELAQFMERTKPASALSRNRMDEIIADNSIYNSKVMNMEQEDEIKKAYQTDNDEMVMDTNEFLERYNEAQKEGEYFSQFTPLEIKQKGLEQQYGEFLNLREQLKVEGKDLDKRMEGLKEDGASLDLAVGEYVKSREKVGSFLGGVSKKVAKGYGIVFAGATGLAIDITSVKYAALLIATGMPAKDAYAQADAWSKKTKGFGKGGGSYTPFSKVANQYVSQDQKGLQQLIRDRGTEVGDKIGTETSEEYIDSAGFIEGSLYGVAESVPAMMTGIGGLFTMAVDIVNQETENNPLFKDISELEKLAIAAPIGVVGAALEKVGLSKALKGTAFTKQATLYFLKKFGAKVTTKSFSEFVSYEMRTGGKKLLTKSFMAALSEAETGGLQEVSDKVFKNIYNEIKGQELFQETDTWAQFFYEVGEAAVAEGIGGAAIGSVGSVVNGATGGNFGEVSNETFALFKDLMNDPYLKGAYEVKIKRKIITGEITKAEGKRQMQAAEVIAGVMSEIPDSYSEKNQRKALQLLLEKKALEDKISKSNKLLVKGLQDRVDGIDNSLEAIGEANDLAVELMSDEEVDLPQEIKDLDDDEVYTFTVETLEDVPESQRGNAEKVEGAEITTRQTILGIPVGPETTIKSGVGYTYTITGKEAKTNANAIQESSTKDVDVQEPSTDSGKVGEGDTAVQPSVTGETQEEGESESDTTQTAEEKIEAAEDARKLFEEEMGESGTDPVSEPETVLPKVTTEKLEPVVSDENLSITEEVDGESDPYYATEQFSSSPEGGVTAKQHENRILKRAEKAVKAIKKILPKTKIILHRSEAAYTKAINAKKGDASSGSYVYNNKDGTGTIHVNVPRANKRTIAHEVFHAVLISKYKGNEAEIRSITKRMLAAVKKNVKDRALKNKLQEFSDGYEKFNDEEYLAELVGFLGDNYDSLGPKGKNIIKRWLEKIGEILGREPEINVDADVLELLNTIGKSVKRGEEIQGDVIDKSFSQIETEAEVAEETKVESETKAETEVAEEAETEAEVAEETEAELKKEAEKVEAELEEMDSDELKEESKKAKSATKIKEKARQLAKEILRNKKRYREFINEVGDSSSDMAKFIAVATTDYINGKTNEIVERYSEVKEKIEKIVRDFKKSVLIALFLSGSIGVVEQYYGKDVVNYINEEIIPEVKALPSYIERGLVKEFGLDVEESVAPDIVEEIVEAEVNEVGETNIALPESKIHSVIDEKRDGGGVKLSQHSNYFNNEDGFVYNPIPTKGNRKAPKTVDGAATAHFFILDKRPTDFKDIYDADNKELQRQSEWFKNRSEFKKAPDSDFFPVFSKTDDGGVRVTYKKKSEITKEDAVIQKLVQYKASDIDFSKSKPAGSQYSNIRGYKDYKVLVTKKGEGIQSVIFKNDSLYSKFSGAAGLFIAETPDGKRFIKDFSGSVKNMKDGLKSFAEITGVKEGDITISFYDAGSVTAKPAGKNSKINRKDSRYFNTKSYSVSGLAFPVGFETQAETKAEAEKPTTRQQKVNVFEGGEFVDNPSTAMRQQRIGNFEVTYTENEKIAEYVKDGRITEPENLESFRGNKTAITSPDDMVVGEISFEGEKIFEGQGGLFFVTKFGDVWAAGDETTATKLANMINKSVDANGGKGYLTLTKGTDKKLISSAAGVNSSLGIIDVLLNQNILPKAVIRTAVNKVIKDFGGGNINLTGSSKQMISQLRKFFGDKKNATFEARGTVMERIITEIGMDKRLGDLKKKDSKLTKILGGDLSKTLVGGKTSKTANSLVDLVASLAAEDITKGLNTGDIYGVIEVDGKVEYYPGDHPSYPAHIRQVNGNPPVLHLPKDRPAAKNYLMRDSNKIYKTPAVSPTEYGSFYEMADSKVTDKKKPTTQRQQKVVRFQETIKKSDTPIDIIKKAVALGIDQKVVLNDLLINYSTLNIKQRKELLAVNIDLFTSVPDAFLNVKGGYKKGIALFNKINDKIKKLNEDKNNKLTKQQVVEKAIEFLRNTSEYKAEADFVKSKGKLRAKAEASTQQLKMEAEFQKSLKDFRPSKDLAKRLRDIKAKITQRIKGGRDLQEVKRQLRNYIRQSLPLGEYTKSDVVKLIREITALTTKELSGRQLETTMMRISSFVAKKNIKNLITKLDKLLDVSDLTKIESGTLKGKKVSNEVRKRIIAIKESMPKPSEGADVLGDRIDKWNERINKFQKNPINTPAEIKEMADLQVMIDLTNAYMQDTFSGIDPDIEQVATLESVIQGLESLRREGKSELEKEMATQRRKYLEDFQVAYEDINQVKVNLIPTEFTTDDAKKALKDEGVNDPTDDQIYDKISELNEAEAVRIRKELDSLSKQTSEKKSKLMAKAKISVKNLALKIPEYIDRYLNREETLQGLMAIISKGPGELFGGKMRELVYDKINKSLIQYKSRNMKIKADVTSNMKRIFGKNWESINRKNSIAKTTGVYKNVEEVNKAKKDYRKNPTQENKKKLKEVIELNNIVLSPNQIYYQYNQYQDPANIKSFANEENNVFKEDPERIMKELYATLKPEVQEFAKYQREVLFPSLYDHYNSVYKKIYRTDMPWNQFYAGRIYRDGDKADIKEVEPLMLNGMSKFNQTIGPASTKSRIDNSTPISYMDGTDTMMNYISDMEWFAAFGESIRDISKIFSNNDIKKSIELNHSPDMLKLINSSINKIAAKGLRQGASNALINGTNNIFVLRSLGLSATVALKQLTSIPTYANVIGPVNYLKYAVKNKAEMIKVYKEILANSVYMQDRNLTSITKTIETYSASNQNTTPIKAYFGGVTKGFNYYVNFLMYAVKAGDKAAIMFGGMPNYSYYKAKFKSKNPKATEQEAIDYAITNFEADTKDTQQSSDLQDKSYWQTEVPALSFLNLFKTSQKQYFRKQRDAFRQLRRMTMAMDTKAGKGSFGQNLRTLFLYHSVMPLLFKYVSLGLPGLWADWGEDDTEELIVAGALGNVGALLLVAEITELSVAASQGKPWATDAKSLPILEMVSDYLRVKMYRDKAANAEKPNPETVAKWQKQMDMSLLEFSTLPVRKVDKIYKNLEKISKGDVDGPGDFMLKLFAFGDSVIEGDNKKKPSKTKQIDVNPIFMDQDDNGKLLPPL